MSFLGVLVFLGVIGVLAALAGPVLLSPLFNFSASLRIRRKPYSTAHIVASPPNSSAIRRLSICDEYRFELERRTWWKELSVKRYLQIFFRKIGVETDEQALNVLWFLPLNCHCG